MGTISVVGNSHDYGVKTLRVSEFSLHLMLNCQSCKPYTLRFYKGTAFLLYLICQFWRKSGTLCKDVVKPAIKLFNFVSLTASGSDSKELQRKNSFQKSTEEWYPEE